MKFSCHVCRKSFPTTIKHDHHVVPRRIRKTSSTVRVCPTCHTNIHRIAEMILAGSNYSELREMLQDLYKRKKSALRCTKLARSIVEETILTQDNPQPSGSPVSIRIFLSPEDKSLLKLAARDKNCSVTKYIRGIVQGIIINFRTKGDGNNTNLPNYL